MKLKFLWLKLILKFIGFRVVETRLVDSFGRVLKYTLNNDYNTQSGRCVNYPFLSISVETSGMYSTQIYQDNPIIENKVYTDTSPYSLIQLWLTVQRHYRSMRKDKFKWSNLN